MARLKGQLVAVGKSNHLQHGIVALVPCCIKVASITVTNDVAIDTVEMALATARDGDPPFKSLDHLTQPAVLLV